MFPHPSAFACSGGDWFAPGGPIDDNAARAAAQRPPADALPEPRASCMHAGCLPPPLADLSQGAPPHVWPSDRAGPPPSNTAGQPLPDAFQRADRMQRLAVLKQALINGGPLGSRHVLELLTLLTLSPPWPAALLVQFEELGCDPPQAARLPRPAPWARPAPGTPIPLPIVIQRLSDGSLRAGRRCVPEDLRIPVKNSAWAPMDALLCGVRLLHYEENAAALDALLSNTGLRPGPLTRQVDEAGLPCGDYLALLQVLRAKCLRHIERFQQHMARQTLAAEPHR